MKKLKRYYGLALIIVGVFSVSSISYAQPYGTGTYDANVPYGDETSLSISTDGNISIPITPTSEGTLATGLSNVTVTSTDVNGYKLYIRALTNTYMDNLGAQLPTSANSYPSSTSLAMDTWGFNTNGSPTNFAGIALSDTLIKSVSLPVSGGDVTSITYGMKLDLAKPAGNYVATVVYTAVPQTN